MEAAHLGAGEPRPSAFRVFKAGEATEMSAGHVSWANVSDDDKQKMRSLLDNGMQDGALVRCLFEDHDAGMSLSYGWFKANFMVPRHSHSGDCLYYVTSGEMHIGDQVLKPGDGVFIPGESLYTFSTGPQGVEIVEFRTEPQFDIKIRNTGAIWDRMARIVADNRDQWRTASTPVVAEKLRPRQGAEIPGAEKV